jgi:glycosyltransferase involved in cell wall biosynthesis
MPRLLLLTESELTRDPRARRAAAAALAQGLEVIGVCGRASGEPPAPLDGISITRVGREGGTDPDRETGLAAPRRRGPLVRELRGVLRLGRLLRRTLQIRRGGRGVGRVDIVHANDLQTLTAGWLLARRSRARLVYDAHELYRAFDPDPPRLYRAATAALEGALARRADAVVTVSAPLATELVSALRLDGEPFVVLNAPALEQTELPIGPGEGPLRAVYQGAFGPGRPLADLLEAARLAPSIRLAVRAVRVDPSLIRAEAERIGVADRVEVAAPVPPDRVVEALHGFEVGVIFDRPQTRNSELTSPNRLFEYLMAGLAVVAPWLPALAEVVEGDRTGVLFEPGRVDELAAALERLAADREELAEMRRRARRAAIERYNAEQQAETLAAAWAVRS